MIKYIVEFSATTEGNWCSGCTGKYDTREAAQAAIDSDPTAKPDPYGNTCEPYITSVEVDEPQPEIDPDAQCPEHGCARHACDHSH